MEQIKLNFQLKHKVLRLLYNLYKDPIANWEELRNKKYRNAMDTFTSIIIPFFLIFPFIFGVKLFIKLVVLQEFQIKNILYPILIIAALILFLIVFSRSMNVAIEVLKIRCNYLTSEKIISTSLLPSITGVWVIYIPIIGKPMYFILLIYSVFLFHQGCLSLLDFPQRKKRVFFSSLYTTLFLLVINFIFLTGFANYLI